MPIVSAPEVCAMLSANHAVNVAYASVSKRKMITDMIAEISDPARRQDHRIPLEVRDRFARERWFDVPYVRQTARHDDYVVGLASLMTACLEASDGLFALRDAAHLTYRLDPDLMRRHVHVIENAFVLAMDMRCEFRFQTRRRVTPEDLRAFREVHGWEGFGAVETNTPPRNNYRPEVGDMSWLWFTDFQTATMARMAF